ncbi:PucR family transcriptional regulator [Nitriliruptor alkaliphilus]|uniref:PucR family transcriptional regulator n=1 Tax=Nitriliruptor alkaliphilus TaxID=427918 RepID=UPI000696FA77|nr:PucR family transcriptional regulator [Nitriliruptor alkaliphilus]
MTAPGPGPGAGARLPVDRSLPLTSLPAAVAARDGDATVAVLDDLPWPRFDAALVDAVIRPAIGEIVDRVVAELEARGEDTGLDGPIERGVRTATERALRQFSAAVETGTVEVDVRFYRGLGARHARAGLPLAQLLGLFGSGGLACWRAIAELHGSGRLPDDLVPPAGEFVMAFVQELSSAAAVGYATEMGGGAARSRTRRTELVRAIIEGDEAQASDLATRGHEVGWPVPRTLSVGVVVASGGVASEHGWPPQVIAAPVRGRWSVLVPGGLDLGDLDLGEVTLAVGPRVPLDRAPESAAVADDLARLLASQLRDRVAIAPGAHRAVDHAVDLALLRSPALADELVTEWLAPLLALPARRAEPLLETLEAWLASPGHLTAIGRQLHVHVRTVRYRLDAVRELLGAVVDEPSARTDLALAVRAVRHTANAAVQPTAAADD